LFRDFIIGSFQDGGIFKVVTTNTHKYHTNTKNMFRQNADCLGLSEFTVSVLITRTLVAELQNWPFSQLSDLHHIDLGLGHMAYCRAALIIRCLKTKYSSNHKTFLRTEGCT